MWLFWKLDRFPEPPNVVWTTFVLGIACIFVIIPINSVLDLIIPAGSNLWLAGGRRAFFQAAIPEELGKFAVLFFYCARHAHFDEPMDGLVYGAAASLGFAAFENVLYVLDGGMAVAIARALTAVPGHCLFGAIMGYFIALYVHSNPRRPVYLVLSLVVPILLHGAYDWPLMVPDSGVSGLFAITLVVVIIEAGITTRLMRKFRAEQIEYLRPHA